MTKSALLTKSSFLALSVAVVMIAAPAFNASQVASELFGISSAEAARVKAARGGGGGGHRASPPPRVRSSAPKNINNGTRHASNSGNIGNNTHIGNNTINNNNVNINKNVNVNVDNHGGGWDNDWDDHYHPVATAAAVTATVMVTAAVVGSVVNSIPPSCSNVMIGNVVYYQCGSSWYQPQYVGTSVTYIVVPPPR